MTQPSSRMAYGFSLGHLCNDFAPCAVWIIGPAVALAMDLSPAQLGMLFAIHSAGSALAFFPAGLVSDHISDRGRLLLLTFVWVAVGYFIASFAPNYWMLAILLAVAGIGDAVWHPVATGVLVQQHPKARAKALGIHAMGGSLAEVLGPLAVGFLLVYVDWQTALQLCVIPTAIMAIVFIPIAAKVPKKERTRISRTDFVDIWQTWRTPAGMRFVALICCYNMAAISLLSMIPLHLQQTHTLSISNTGMAFSAMVLAGALLQPYVGSLSDRIGRRPITIYGNLIAAICAAVMFLSPGLITLIVVEIIAIGTLVAIRSAILAASVEHAGSKESTTLGLTFSVMDGVGALGALMAGAVGTIQLEYAFALAAGLSFMAVILALGLPRPTKAEVAA
jgi:MFS transporter, FSR family, fosmidomycin resistance protein